MKILRTALVGLALVSVAAAQTAQSRAELYSEIDSALASNQAMRISVLRGVLKDLVASHLNFETDGAPLYASGIGSLVQAHSAALDIFSTNGSAYYLARGNHTGTQAIATITGLQDALDAKAASSHTHSNATTSAAGFLSAADKTKLDGIAAGATANSADATLLARANHTGTQTASTISDFASAAASAAPVQSVAGRTGIVTLVKGDVGLGSVDNTSDASKPVSTAMQTALNAKASLSALIATNGAGINSGGLVHWTQLMGVPAAFADGTDDGAGGTSYTFSAPLAESAGTVSISAATTSAAGTMSAADKTKLDGIAAGATANSSDATLLARTNHTGTQAISTISGLQTALDGKAATSHTHTASDVSDYASAARAQVEAMLVAGGNVTLTPSGSGAARQLTVAASGGGGGGWTSGLLFTTASAQTISSNSDETSILSGTIPAGTLGTQGCIRIVGAAAVLNSSGSTAAVTLRVKLGATTLYADASVSLANNAATRTCWIELYLFADGATNAQRLTGFITISGAAAATTGYGGIDSAPTLAAAPFGGTSAEDTTSDKTLDVTVQLSASNANLAWTTYKASAWKL